jgi:nitrous oxide reductase
MDTMSNENEVEEVKPQGVNRRHFMLTAALGAGAVALNSAISASEVKPAGASVSSSKPSASAHASSAA